MVSKRPAGVRFLVFIMTSVGRAMVLWCCPAHVATLILPRVVLGVATVAPSALKSLLHRARETATSGNLWKPRGLLPTGYSGALYLMHPSELSDMLMSRQWFLLAFV